MHSSPLTFSCFVCEFILSQDARRSSPYYTDSAATHASTASTTTSVKVSTVGSEWVRMPYVDDSYTHPTNNSSVYTTGGNTSQTGSGSTDYAEYSDEYTTSYSTNFTDSNPNPSPSPAAAAATAANEYIDDYRRRVTFPSFSLQRVAQHLDNHTVYCVSYGLTMIATSSGSGSGSSGGNSGTSGGGTGGGVIDFPISSTTSASATTSSYQYRAEGCSALPVGSQWLSLALACIDRLDTNLTASFKDGCRLTAGQVLINP